MFSNILGFLSPEPVGRIGSISGNGRRPEYVGGMYSSWACADSFSSCFVHKCSVKPSVLQSGGEHSDCCK